MTATKLPEKQRVRRGHDFYPQNAMPALYETENLDPADKVIAAHYFVGSCDWWLVEYDPETGIGWGYASLGDDEFAEWGDVSLPELEAATIGGWQVVERDCFWEPKRTADAKLPGRPF